MSSPKKDSKATEHTPLLQQQQQQAPPPPYSAEASTSSITFPSTCSSSSPPSQHNNTAFSATTTSPRLYPVLIPSPPLQPTYLPPSTSFSSRHSLPSAPTAYHCLPPPVSYERAHAMRAADRRARKRWIWAMVWGVGIYFLLSLGVAELVQHQEEVERWVEKEWKEVRRWVKKEEREWERQKDKWGNKLSHPAGEVHTWETDDVDRIVVEQAIALASNGSRLDGVTASAVVA